MYIPIGDRPKHLQQTLYGTIWPTYVVSAVKLQPTNYLQLLSLFFGTTSVPNGKLGFFPKQPHAGSGVVRMDPLRFLAGCRTRRL